MGRDVRTVVRWEKEKGLPVRRLPGGKRQSVFAIAAEIDAWAAQQGVVAEERSGLDLPPAPRDLPPEPTQRETAPGRPRSPRPSMWVAVAAGCAVILGVAQWGVSSMARRADAAASAASPRKVAFDTPAGPVRFVRTGIETAARVYRVIAADLNEDGNMDVAFTSGTGGVLGVLLGTGDGGFLPARVFQGCLYSDGIVAGDFNRDGHLDVAVACFQGNTVEVFWGRGDGTFPSHTTVALPGGPRFLAVHDFNGDGWPDLAVSSFGDGSLILLRNERGSFVPRTFAKFEQTCVLTVADLNEGPDAELIASVRDHGRYGLAIFRGDRNRGMKFVRFLPWNEKQQEVASLIRVADLDGDGTPDLITSLFNGLVLIQKGLGHGEFREPVVLAGIPRQPGGRHIALADVNRDGHLDLVVTDPAGQSLMLFTGDGRGEFIGPSTLVVGVAPFTPVLADFNNDGLPDILISAHFGDPMLLTAVGGSGARRRED